jgi:hypothetical protein
MGLSTLKTTTNHCGTGNNNGVTLGEEHGERKEKQIKGQDLHVTPRYHARPSQMTLGQRAHTILELGMVTEQFWRGLRDRRKQAEQATLECNTVVLRTPKATTVLEVEVEVESGQGHETRRQWAIVTPQGSPSETFPIEPYQSTNSTIKEKTKRRETKKKDNKQKWGSYNCKKTEVSKAGCG